MKTALVHDWLYSVSGAEKVLEAIYELFPSKVYTLIYSTKHMQSFSIPKEAITTSFIQKLPLASQFYPYYLPFFPFAIEAFNLSEADVIISSSSCVAKGVLTNSSQLHICYCHTPMRSLWDLYFDSLQTHHLSHGIKGLLTKFLLHKIRNWDLLHAMRVDHFIANSKHVAKRIEKTYRRQAAVIYPPIDCDYFQLDTRNDEGFYLTAARLVPYKKVDVIVEAFVKLKNRKLIVIGDGPQLSKLKAMANSSVEFVGHVSQEELKKYFGLAKAFIYMAYEDFGLFPVEAQATGLPVIAYGRGGCLETVIDRKTGVLFFEQTTNSLIEGIKTFESCESKFDKKVIRQHAETFSASHFHSAFQNFVKEKYLTFVNEQAL